MGYHNGDWLTARKTGDGWQGIIAEATLALDEMQEAGVAQGVSQCKRIIGFRIPLTPRYYELDDGVARRIVLHDLPILRAETQALLHSPERGVAD